MPDEPCPTLIADHQEGVVRSNCMTGACPVRLDQRQCQIDLDLDVCSLPDTTASIQTDGTVLVDGCDTNTDPGRAAFATTCGECRLQIFVRDRSPAPIASVERLSLHQGRMDSRFLFFEGYVNDMTEQDGMLIILGMENNFGTQACLIGNETTRLFTVDPARLEIVRTTTVSGCASRLSPRPSAGEVYLLLPDPVPPRVLRVGRDGAVLAETTLALGRDGMHQVYAMAVWPDPLSVVALSVGRAIEGEVDDPSVLVFLDPNDLSETQRYTFNDQDGRALFVEPPLLWGAIEDAYFQLNVAEGQLETFRIGFDAGLDADVFVFARAAAGPLVMSSLNDAPGVFSLDSEGTLVETIYYEREAAMTAAIQLQEDPTMMLAGVRSREDNTALLSLLEPRSAAFDPRAQEIGFGPVTDLTRVGNSYFALLPWTGDLVKITIAD